MFGPRNEIGDRPFSSRPNLVRSSNEVQEVLAVPTLNCLALVLAGKIRTITKEYTDNIVEAPRVTCLPAIEFMLILVFFL